MAKPVPPNSKLRKAFCEEFVVDKHRRAAAERAGYKKETAEQAAQQCMRDPVCVAYIDYLLGLAAKRNRCTVDRVLEEYAKIAFHDVRKLYDASGALIPITELGDDEAGAIAGIEVNTTTSAGSPNKKGAAGPSAQTKTTKVRMSDKKAALDSIAKHLGMFKEQIDVNHSGNVTLQISNSDAEL